MKKVFLLTLILILNFFKISFAQPLPPDSPSGYPTPVDDYWIGIAAIMLFLLFAVIRLLRDRKYDFPSSNNKK
ncbi:MAG: hypothetical protein K9H26_14625 [Prolixibacteraceae bacterium]|nr:hypothetical protein [Prolixibacteraceae bacterium]